MTASITRQTLIICRERLNQRLLEVLIQTLIQTPSPPSVLADEPMNNNLRMSGAIALMLKKSKDRRQQEALEAAFKVGPCLDTSHDSLFLTLLHLHSLNESRPAPGELRITCPRTWGLEAASASLCSCMGVEFKSLSTFVLAFSILMLLNLIHHNC